MGLHLPEEPVVVAELEAERAGDVAGVVLPAVVRVFVEAGAVLGAVGLLGRGRGQRCFRYRLPGVSYIKVSS